MKIEDLKVHVSNFRGDRTVRNINVYVNIENFNIFVRQKNCIVGYKLKSVYFYDGNFSVFEKDGINQIPENYCIINSDIGEDYSEVLTEDERTIKKLLE